MSTATAAYTLYVKGDPETNTLGDCPFCHRAMLAMETKGVQYEKVYIDFDNKPQWLVDAGGKVPCLKDDEKMIPDSTAIVEYLEAQENGVSLAPGETEGVGGKVFPSFVQFLKAGPDEAAEKEAALKQELTTLDSYLASMPGPFIGGDQLNDTDCSLAPKLYHMTTALSHFRGWEMGAGEFENVKAYFARMKELPTWKAVEYTPEMIIKGWSAHGLSKA